MFFFHFFILLSVRFIYDVINTKTPIPLAGSKWPAGDDPEGQHDNQQYGARADGYQSLEDKASVEVDSIERSNTTRRSVRKQPTVQ